MLANIKVKVFRSPLSPSLTKLENCLLMHFDILMKAGDTMNSDCANINEYLASIVINYKHCFVNLSE